MKNLFVLSIFVSLLSVGLFSCKDTPPKAPPAPVTDTPVATLPTWAQNANIYEVNIRQYTPEGTLKAFEGHLPRLKEMGVDILWLMPINPISKTKRKGTLGSYYAVSDFRAVNPEFGTMQDFDDLVKKVHSMGMYILIDWVPHHTGWDHVWITEHPEYYSKDKDGNIIDPINEETGDPWGWTDVAELNFNNQEMRKTMIEDMEFWVRDHDIDGYRVDHAHGVPDDFWAVASPAVRKHKSVFMLAESAKASQRNGGYFDMDYAWSLHHLMNDIAKGEKNAGDLDTYLREDDSLYSKGFHMQFTTNHDENSWAGTVFERMNDSHKTFAVMAATIEGMPLLYSGQEEPIRKRLEFFEKDAINWGKFEYADFYKTLFALKKKNKALWNGVHGGELKRISTDNNEQVFAFSREKDGDKILVILNLSKEAQSISLDDEGFAGSYKNVFSNIAFNNTKGMTLNLGPWAYKVYSNK